MKYQNLILNADSYKYSHFLQYPEGTKYVSSYIEPRVGAAYDKIVFFGLQAFIKAYLLTPITLRDVEIAKELVEAHGEPFNYDGWMKILTKHNGYLPIEIEALPEGSVVQPGIPLVQVRNTDPEMPWLTSFIETALLRAVWYPTTVATKSRAAREVIARYLEKTGDIAGLPFKLHDFGARGATSSESAMIGGLAHLAAGAMGTDTVEALVGARLYYNENMAGFSIPAAEHSTITSWGEDREVDAYRNMLKQFGGEGKLVAVVSDSYDIDNAVTNIWGKELRDEVRDMGGVLVVRPDSGDPVEMTLNVVTRLWDAFGGVVNEKGYKVLAPCVRMIQGDGVDVDSIEEILANFERNGFSADNIAFGMGGGLLQKLDRDTLRFAMKANAIDFGQGWVPVQKVVKSDTTKASKGGRQYVCREGGVWKSAKETEATVPSTNYLQPVFRDGKLLKDITLASIRQNCEFRDTEILSRMTESQLLDALETEGLLKAS